MKNYIKILIKDFCRGVLDIKNGELEQLIEDFIEPKEKDISIQNILSHCKAPDFKKRMEQMEEDKIYYDM